MNKLINAFEKEMKNGVEIYFYSTYMGDGDFYQFSKIISQIRLPEEMIEQIGTEDDLEKFCSQYAKMLQENDAESLGIDYEIKYIGVENE